MSLQFPSVNDFGLEATAGVLTRGFSDYYVKFPFTAAALVQMARTDSLDLAASRVVVREGIGLGVALMARRGWTSRLAGMAIVPEARRTGAGRALVERVLADARERGDREMVLEVIVQNEPAVRLYEATGFTRVRRLVGFSGPGAADAAAVAGLADVDPRAMAAIVTREGLPDLPWQLSGETLAHLSPPSVACHLEGAWIALANVGGPTVTLRGLVTEGNCQRQGRALALLRAVMARYPGKEWRVPAIWPEELAGVFVSAGLTRTTLSQWQMRRWV